MNDIAIRVENLSKLYHIGKTQQRHDTLRDALAAAFKRSDVEHSNEDEHWALRDVSFEVKRGELLGIIGRNGAGKSTLLKILSRITEPTSGRAEIHGRVGSLLEVGTGFHPELTGRENIYLNGAILGMHRREITRKFDEIVAFAEIEKFLDTPVKRYSSGMYVRLAFAVAAHLEPEILLVDEVLAVGDSGFQQKCLGKMSDVASGGRTVLFVSHNMAAVKHICPRSIVIASGKIACDDNSHRAIGFYQTQLADRAARPSLELRFSNAHEGLNTRFEVRTIELLDERGDLKTHIQTGDYVRFRIGWYSAEDINRGGVELGIHTLDGVPLIRYSTRPVSNVDVAFQRGMNSIECEFPNFPLAGGEYYLAVALTRPMVEWLYRNEVFAMLEVGERDFFGTGTPITSARSFIAVPHRWTTNITNQTLSQQVEALQ